MNVREVYSDEKQMVVVFHESDTRFSAVFTVLQWNE